MPSDESAQDVLRAAWMGGVRFYDTAHAYGVSEERLGRFLSGEEAASEARVIGKVSAPGGRRASIRGSVDRIGRRFWGMLLHAETDVDDWAGCWREVFREARAEGWMTYAGASIYSADRARQALSLPDVDIIQVPGSLFDRRMIRSGVVSAAAEARVAVFVRSVYAQGLIGRTEENLPVRATFAVDAIRTLNAFCRERGVEPGAFAAAYAWRRFLSCVLLLGAERTEQVRVNIERIRHAGDVPVQWMDEWDEIWPEDRLPLIDPRLWSGAS